MASAPRPSWPTRSVPCGHCELSACSGRIAGLISQPCVLTPRCTASRHGRPFLATFSWPRGCLCHSARCLRLSPTRLLPSGWPARIVQSRSPAWTSPAAVPRRNSVSRIAAATRRRSVWRGPRPIRSSLPCWLHWSGVSQPLRQSRRRVRAARRSPRMPAASPKRSRHAAGPSQGGRSAMIRRYAVITVLWRQIPSGRPTTQMMARRVGVQA